MKSAQPASLPTKQHQSALALLRHAERFVQADDGVTSIEYALIGSLIAVVIVAAVAAVGTNLESVFNAVAADF